MIEYLIKEETLTDIADEVRTLTGVSSKMGTQGITENLQEVNEEVDSQADLIAQIASALEGKAAGGSASVETCTVTIENWLVEMNIAHERERLFAYTDGSLNSVAEYLPMHSDPMPLEPMIHNFTVAKGTIIYSFFGFYSIDGDHILLDNDGAGSGSCCVVKNDCTLQIG